jgi:low temperature requirement protein LtrA
MTTQPSEPIATADRSWHVRMSGRDPAEAHRTATPLELLFDLCFVIAVGQAAASLHHELAEGMVGHAVVSFLVVFFTIWWPWVNFTWFASAFDTDDVPYRLLTFVQIAGILIVTGGVPLAFEDLDFRIAVLGYVVMRAALVGQWLRAAREDPVHRRTALRFALTIGLIQVGWVVRLAIPGPMSYVAFVALGILELAVPIWAERAGPPTPWNARHVTERYGLFTIIVIGECLLAATTTIQATFDAGGLTLALAAVAGGGLLLVFALWWSYFKDSAALLPDVRLRTAIAWGYGHYVIFASVAAIGAGLQLATESTLGHGELDSVGVAATLGVPVVTYLIAAGILHGRAEPARAVRLTVGLSIAIAVVTAGATVIGVPAAVLAMGAIVSTMVVVHVIGTSRGDPLRTAAIV